MPKIPPTKTASADYIFLLEEIDPQTGIYEAKGVVTDENQVENFLNEESIVKRVQIFILGKIEGPCQIINSWEEFMEFN